MTRNDKRDLIADVMMLFIMLLMVTMTIYFTMMKQYFLVLLGTIISSGILVGVICGPVHYYMEKYKEGKKRKQGQEKQ